MRQLLVSGLVLFSCGLASAQEAWTYPGQYAEPFVRRLSTPVASPEALPTPFLTLHTPPLAAGASNSTLENATGSYNPPIPEAGSSARNSSPVASGRYGIELGAATFQMDYGVAQVAGIGPRKKAKKVYTNPDVGVNEATNTIKFRGKVERLN
jgi:hypothetical protein